MKFTLEAKVKPKKSSLFLIPEDDMDILNIGKLSHILPKVALDFTSDSNNPIQKLKYAEIDIDCIIKALIESSGLSNIVIQISKDFKEKIMEEFK